ncbi:hypothetical protein DSO57_1000658 [Entomophthora muscae]|uniref:Uncharacterized protein n=1 Tax=Entomophthora muscae TaxID=34485 RepID=A0ACC2TWW1_9FUNG|nr:hypothetical protein DSO57_1000658 [Entomophthora muscae]
MSPFFAKFGFDLKSFSSTILESRYPQEDKKANQMKKIHSDLILFLTKACKEYKKYTNHHRSPEKNYSVGLKKYGPLKVLMKLSSLNYNPELLAGSSIHDVFCVVLLTPFDGDPKSLEERNPDPEIVSNTFEWEVEDIIDSCQVKGKSKFLVK